MSKIKTVELVPATTPEFPAAQANLRNRMVRAAVEWENLDNDLVSTMEAALEAKRAALQRAKDMLAAEVEFLNSQV